jgi:hypothetical protein
MLAAGMGVTTGATGTSGDEPPWYDEMWDGAKEIVIGGVQFWNSLGITLGSGLN